MFLLFQLPHEFVKAFMDVLHLLLHQSLQLLFDLLYEFRVLFDESLCIVNHLTQVYHILLHRVSYIWVRLMVKAITHFFNLHELMTVVVIIDAFNTNRLTASLAEILYHFVRMFGTGDAVKVAKEQRNSFI